MKSTFAAMMLTAVQAAYLPLAFAGSPTTPTDQSALPPLGHKAPSMHPHLEGPERVAGPDGPGFAVISDLEQLDRLYADAGRETEMASIYHDILNRSQDPFIRHFVYDSLVRMQLRPANPDQAIATLRTSLTEDLSAASKLSPRDASDHSKQAD